MHDSVSTALIQTPEMARDVELTWSADSLPRLCQWASPPEAAGSWGSNRATCSDVGA